jgi:pimeloyl-ACP methyl ester carboxylesterase
MYDYGTDSKNMAHYNQTTPPQYDLSQVKVPVALYAGTEDWLADPKDVDYLRNQLPNVVQDFNIKDYDHMDFIYALNAQNILYKSMIQLMNKYI